MFERILVPVDGSPTSNKALVTALQMASSQGGRARVRVIHVVNELAFAAGFDAYGGNSGDLITIMREAGVRIIDDAMAIVRASGVEGDSLLFDNFGGRLGEMAAQAATQWKADLVVVGTHGRRGIGHLLLGSGAEQVIRLAPVPVLVVRASDAERATWP